RGVIVIAEAGRGMFPADKSAGRGSISGSSASTLRRPSRLSSYFWKRFIRKIDHLLSKILRKLFARKAVLTWNFESRLRTDLSRMSKGLADPSSRNLAKSIVILVPP